MKTIKILFLSVFLIFLVNTVSAVVVYGEWNSNNAQSIAIEDGDSVDFSAYFGTMYPPMTINIGLYDSGNLIHSFENTVVNQKSFAQMYTVNQDIYSGPGDFQVKILGSDNFGEMSNVLYLKVINNPPVITSAPITEVNENDPYEYQVMAVDADNHTLTYSLSAPEWLSIDSQTGLITGTAPEVDTNTDFSVSVIVSDGTDTDTQPYVLTVIWVPNPFLSQTLTLIGDVNVEYNAILSELDMAVLEIYYKELGSPEPDYELIETRNIASSPYNEIFDFYDIHEKTKGDYRFIIKDPNSDLSETDEIIVPDYAPEVDLSSISANFNEEDSINITLPVPTDINPEDNPVVYITATPDNKTSILDFESNLLTLEGNRDEIGNYQVELEFGAPVGETASAILEGEIYNLPDISGVLEDNEENSGIQGVIRVYYINTNNESDYLPLEIDKIYEGSIVDADLGKIETTSYGNFGFQINEKASELDEIILQARIGTSQTYTGYVRTIELSGNDNLDILVRAVPYAPYEDDPQSFRDFMSELCSDQPNTRFDFDGEYIRDGEFDPEYWPDLVNYTGLIGIEILSENPFGEEYGTFTTEQQNNIKNKILNSTDISGIIGNYTINGDDVHILTGNQSGHYDLYDRPIVYGKTGNETVKAHQGWIIVVPYSNMSPAGLADTSSAGTLVYRGTIYLRLTGDTVISHEFGHMFIGSGHPLILVDQSIMSKGTVLQTTGPADKKAGKLIYEQTYMTFSLVLFPELDSLYNILGLGFYRESQITGTFSEYYSSEPEEDEEEDFTEGQQNSDDDNIISSDNIGASNDVNADTPYEETIYLQSNEDKKNLITSLSNIIRQVISFISQKIRSIF